MWLRLCVLLLNSVGVALCIASAVAAPISYSFKGTASGKLGGSSFERASFELRLDGDAYGIVPTTYGFENVVAGSIAIDGVGGGTARQPAPPGVVLH